MPRPGQVIPAYLVPHVSTLITDNTVFQDAAAPVDVGTRFICVFTSGKGEDGVLKQFGSVSDYLEEFGNPNYQLYGQPGYMPYAALTSNRALVYCERVMPGDATYANIVVSSAHKEAGEIEGTKTFEVKILAETTNMDDKNDLIINVDATEKADVDADGFKHLPLFGFAIKGRGVYGNTYATRIVSDSLSDKENNYKNYTVELYDTENGFVRKESFRGSLNPTALVGKTSVFLEDVINDSDAGSAKMDAYVHPSGAMDLYDAYNAFMKVNSPDVEIPKFDEVDLISGKTKAGTKLPNYTVILDEKTATLDTPTGIMLAGGTDGSFDAKTAAATRQAAIDTEYIKAIKGVAPYDAAILSKRRTPADLILDANYDAAVKTELVVLAMKRYDSRCVIDGGLLQTITDAINWSEEVVSTIDDFVLSKECNSFKIRDPFNGKVIPLTITYLMAMALPNHYENYGNQTPFQGERFAKFAVPGYIKNSLRPIIDADDLPNKETLYTNRVNFYEYVAENLAVRAVQGTAQTVWSDLSEENNASVTLEMKRKLEECVMKKIYNLAEADDRVKFTEAANRMFEEYIGVKVREVTVTFEMNAFEEERSILHCYMGVTFMTMAKRGIIEIDINKRVTG